MRRLHCQPRMIVGCDGGGVVIDDQRRDGEVTVSGSAGRHEACLVLCPVSISTLICTAIQLQGNVFFSCCRGRCPLAQRLCEDRPIFHWRAIVAAKCSKLRASGGRQPLSSCPLLAVFQGDATPVHALALLRQAPGRYTELAARCRNQGVRHAGHRAPTLEPFVWARATRVSPTITRRGRRGQLHLTGLDLASRNERSLIMPTFDRFERTRWSLGVEGQVGRTEG